MLFYSKQIKNLNKVNSTETISSDICVIGSGPAGATIAVDLAKKGFKVIILESGTKSGHYDSNNFLSEVKCVEKTNLRFGFSKQLGGSTNLWSGRSAILEHADFSACDINDKKIWPIKHKDLEPFFKKASEILTINNQTKLIKNNQTFPLPQKWSQIFSSTILEKKLFQYPKKAFNAGHYIKENCKELNIDVYLGAHVSNLLEDPNDNSITHAIAINSKNQKIKFSAQTFILAAGGIETPRILLNSNNKNKGGIGNNYKQVGCYFSTHPKMNIGKLFLKDFTTTKNPLFTDIKQNNITYRDGIGLNQDYIIKNKKLNHYIQLTPILEDYALSKFDAFSQKNRLMNFILTNIKPFQKITIKLGIKTFNLIAKLGLIQNKVNNLMLRGFFDQYPNINNRIKLSKEKDKYGNPKAEITWKFSDKDKKSVLIFLSDMDNVFKSNNIGTINYESLKKDKMWPIVAIHSHFMGTTRMGKDPKNSVVDKNGKVHGIKNLYITGPSLFATYGYANPVYTIVTLSLWISHKIANNIKKVCQK